MQPCLHECSNFCCFSFFISKSNSFHLLIDLKFVINILGSGGLCDCFFGSGRTTDWWLYLFSESLSFMLAKVMKNYGKPNVLAILSSMLLTCIRSLVIACLQGIPTDRIAGCRYVFTSSDRYTNKNAPNGRPALSRCFCALIFQYFCLL